MLDRSGGGLIFGLGRGGQAFPASSNKFPTYNPPFRKDGSIPCPPPGFKTSLPINVNDIQRVHKTVDNFRPWGRGISTLEM